MVYLSICRAVFINTFCPISLIFKKVLRWESEHLFCSERESCAKHAVSRLYCFFIALLLSFISLSYLR